VEVSFLATTKQSSLLKSFLPTQIDDPNFAFTIGNILFSMMLS